MSSDEPIEISNTNIPVLTEVIRGATLPALDRDALIAELQTKLASRTFALADELLRSSFNAMEATLFEQISARLRIELPELIDATLREHLDAGDIRDDREQGLQTRRDRSPPLRALGSRRLFRTRRQRRALLHRDSAAERDGHAAHGPRAAGHHHGCPDALPPHARPPHSVAARHGSRRHRDADGGRAVARARRHVARATRPREIPRARVAVEGTLGQHDRAADAPSRCVCRLDARTLHDGPRSVASRSRGIRSALRRGPDISRQTARELGSRCCTRHSPISRS